ncbi:hypothetical protein [Saccharothrix sp. ALI-22-I]|uniref:hypothetical protein n=1 Tax=Saccharothrix sp. ALI-22-I TaxID=1933778 RepID=UPI0015C35BE8|nr:hypothetical protein [Saccharothrix sp. ALI-22-I]
MTTLVRTVGFSAGPALGAALGGFQQTAVVIIVIIVITAMGVFATASQMRLD